MPEIVLRGAGIVAIIGELEPAGVPQHVRMHGKRHLGGFAEAGNEMVKAHWADWPATFGNEDVGFRKVFSP